MLKTNSGQEIKTYRLVMPEKYKNMVMKFICLITHIHMELRVHRKIYVDEKLVHSTFLNVSTLRIAATHLNCKSTGSCYCV